MQYFDPEVYFCYQISQDQIVIENLLCIETILASNFFLGLQDIQTAVT